MTTKHDDVSFETHGPDLEPERLVWHPVVDRIEVGQRQAVQLVGADVEYSLAFRFPRLWSAKKSTKLQASIENNYLDKDR